MFKIIWSTNTFKRKFLGFNCHSLNSEEHVDEKNNINNTLIHKSVTCSNVLSCKHNSALIADETLHSCCIHTTWGCAWRRIIPVPNISREIISSMWRVILCDLTPSTSLFWHQSICPNFFQEFYCICMLFKSLSSQGRQLCSTYSKLRGYMDTWRTHRCLSVARIRPLTSHQTHWMPSQHWWWHRPRKLYTEKQWWVKLTSLLQHLDKQ